MDHASVKEVRCESPDSVHVQMMIFLTGIPSTWTVTTLFQSCGVTGNPFQLPPHYDRWRHAAESRGQSPCHHGFGTVRFSTFRWILILLT